jgi:gliding motility-associated-like protein
MRLSSFRFILLIITFVFTVDSQAISQDISGYWQGVFYQPTGGTSTYYPAGMELKQVGNTVTGIETTQLPNGLAYSKINLTGTFSNDTFRYVISGIISQVKPSPTSSWCNYGTGVLIYDAANETLKGNTLSPTCGTGLKGSAELWRLKVLSDTVFCEGSPVNLRVSGKDVKWFSNFPAVTQLQLGNNYSPALTNSTQLFVTQTHYNTQSPALAVNVTIKKRTFSNIRQTICEGQSFLGHSRAGTYIDTLVSSLGCDSIRTINLSVTPKPVVEISKTICTGESYLGHTTSGSYRDTILSGTGCDTVIRLNLKVIRKIPLDLGADITVCSGDTFAVRAGEFNTYLWNDGLTDSYRVLKKPGTYRLTATNECGIFTDEITLMEKPCLVEFPNAFTPNGDGSNDAFRIVNGVLVTQYRLVIYSRWGQKVFETTNPVAGWNGTFNGKEQPQGQYVWFAEYKRNDETKTSRGTVHLIR